MVCVWCCALRRGCWQRALPTLHFFFAARAAFCLPPNGARHHALPALPFHYLPHLPLPWLVAAFNAHTLHAFRWDHSYSIPYYLHYSSV
jgi:hypothetical protein